MKTTFDKFITDNPVQKALFDKEYAEFAYSERLLENKIREGNPSPATRTANRRIYELA